MASEVIAELVRREGAVLPEDVLRWLPEACDALARLAAEGVFSTIDGATLRVSREGGAAVVEPKEFSPVPTNVGAAQVRALAALGFEMLKGAPPPEPFPPDGWVGVRPELARVLGPALAGEGPASPSALARLLRAISGDTVRYVKPKERPDPAPADPRAGEVLGPYELVRQLGSGGMGEVYLARHTRLGLEVAIKLLRRRLLGTPEVVQRFFQEARVVNEINHPHIVQVLDFVEEPQRVYCVMELLQGRTLTALAQEEGPLGVRRVCRLMAQVCEALQAAHARGVIHRDVKPENIFVTRDPGGSEYVKVLDFGVARRELSTEVERTAQGAVLGTPSYMSPEQAVGREIDLRTDLYALGVTLWELFSARSMRSVEAPGRPEVTAAGEPIPGPLGDLIESCLSVDPGRRPASASAVRDVLALFADLPGSFRQSTGEIAVQAGLARRRWWPRAAAAVVSTGLALLVGVLLFLADAHRGLARKDHPAGPSADSGAPAEFAGLFDAGAGTLVVADTRTTEPELPVDAGISPAPLPDAGGGKSHRPPRRAIHANARRHEAEQGSQAVRGAELKRRVAALRERYQRMALRHGEAQLTALERAAYQAALEEALSGEEEGALLSAEQALDAAEKRLGQ